MIMFKKKTFIFIHIPKTAGESIRSCLFSTTHITRIRTQTVNQNNFKSKLRLVRQKLIYDFIDNLKSTPQMLQAGKHSTAQEYKSWLSDNKWNSCFSFTFVRNPWDQVVSFYNHLRKPIYANPEKLGEQYPNFRQTGLLTPYEICKAAIQYEFDEWVFRVYGCGEFEDDGLCQDQSRWIIDDKGQVIVDFVGRYENLDRDFQKVSNIIGISANLPSANTSQRKPYQDYYSEQSIKIIESKFAKTIELFNYRF